MVKRKNITIIVELLRNGKWKEGDVVSSRDLYDIVMGIDAGAWDELFERKEDREDEHGVTRAIGDVLGGHGLQLRKVEGGYLFPYKLPKVKHDMVVKDAVYRPEGVRGMIRGLQKKIFETAKEKGFWNDEVCGGEKPTAETIAVKIALCHSELSEALEDARNGFWKSEKIEAGNFEEELADAVIRILDLAEAMEVDLGAVIQMKMEYNKTRGFKHGKSF